MSKLSILESIFDQFLLYTSLTTNQYSPDSRLTHSTIDTEDEQYAPWTAAHGSNKNALFKMVTVLWEYVE